jgi:hypothetical protein
MSGMGDVQAAPSAQLYDPDMKIRAAAHDVGLDRPGGIYSADPVEAALMFAAPLRVNLNGFTLPRGKVPWTQTPPSVMDRAVSSMSEGDAAMEAVDHFRRRWANRPDTFSRSYYGEPEPPASLHNRETQLMQEVGGNASEAWRDAAYRRSQAYQELDRAAGVVPSEEELLARTEGFKPENSWMGDPLGGFLERANFTKR